MFIAKKYDISSLDTTTILLFSETNTGEILNRETEVHGGSFIVSEHKVSFCILEHSSLSHSLLSRDYPMNKSFVPSVIFYGIIVRNREYFQNSRWILPQRLRPLSWMTIGTLHTKTTRLHRS